MKLSVLTCVLNQVPSWFEAAAMSVSALGPGVEWIVVDDGSDDENARRQEQAALSCGPRGFMKYVRLPANRGLSVARNVALNLAKGEWIAVLDSDDALEKALPSVLEDAPSTTALVSVAAKYFTDEPAWVQSRPIRRFADLYARYGSTPLDPFLWFDFYYHGIVARRSVLQEVGGYDEQLRVGEDQDILLRVAEAAGLRGVHFDDRCGYRYRKNLLGVCATRWEDVLRGYTQTMTAGSQRRGAGFIDCRHAGSLAMDGADIDCYEYLDPDAGWLDWDGLESGKRIHRIPTPFT